MPYKLQKNSDNVDVFQVESLKVEAARECKAAQDQITTTYKLELMKMPKQVIVFTGTPQTKSSENNI